MHTVGYAAEQFPRAAVVAVVALVVAGATVTVVVAARVVAVARAVEVVLVGGGSVVIVVLVAVVLLVSAMGSVRVVTLGRVFGVSSDMTPPIPTPTRRNRRAETPATGA